MAKNMVVKTVPNMTGGAGGGTGRLEKAMGEGGKTPGTMDGMKTKSLTALKKVK
jgi:hypothetical protein